MGDEAATHPDPTTTPRGVADGADVPSYLLVFEADSSSVFVLPAGGELIIGRAEQADLKLRDPGASRQHARLRINEGAVWIADLGSQNGMRVNGQRLVGERPLLSGDVISIGSTSLVYHSRAKTSTRRTSLPFASLRQRAEEELARALRYTRPLSILTIAFGGGLPDKPRVEAAIGEQLRLTDLFGWDGGGELLVFLLPETGPEQARVVARRLLEHPHLAPESRAGLSTCPADGCDVETLFAAARAAASTAEPHALEDAPSTSQSFEIGDTRIVIADPAMQGIYALTRRLATSDLPVLIHGETGTGKELVASALHHWSKRSTGPLVCLSCAAIPENLVESELMGHDRGAFSGAAVPKPGLIEQASGGTLLLDEVGELPLGVQAKFLRLLESQRVMRLGDVREREVDVRVLAATNRDLAEEVKEGRFRRDLFYRLTGGVLWIPPLRDRKQDIPVLAKAFLAEACHRLERPPMVISDAAMQLLWAHDWPGNVRELKNVLEYAVAAYAEPILDVRHFASRLSLSAEITSPGRPVRPSHPSAHTGAERQSVPSSDPLAFRPIDKEVQELEKRRMITALEASEGNRTRAAQMIGMPLRTFLTKMKRYALADRFPR
ncbi:MAG: sigma 54-interacting transcriptional regulator [Deltaproteobacteria bacterium]|nr:sigma 54-interacting transcriptional regulator [Deltaproteobacteria bacterium]